MPKLRFEGQKTPPVQNLATISQNTVFSNMSVPHSRAILTCCPTSIEPQRPCARLSRPSRARPNLDDQQCVFSAFACQRRWILLGGRGVRSNIVIATLDSLSKLPVFGSVMRPAVLTRCGQRQTSLGRGRRR